MNNEFRLDLQIASEDNQLPSEEQLHSWATAALAGRRKVAEISLRIVGSDESRRLNREFRHRDKPTNVLSFPAQLPEKLGLALLGDIVICAPVVAEEALQQGKTLQAHWAHMLVHGTLHLLGYDHENETEAQTMEQLETEILNDLGFPPPYET